MVAAVFRLCNPLFPSHSSFIVRAVALENVQQKSSFALPKLPYSSGQILLQAQNLGDQVHGTARIQSYDAVHITERIIKAYEKHMLAFTMVSGFEVAAPNSLETGFHSHHADMHSHKNPGPMNPCTGMSSVVRAWVSFETKCKLYRH